VTVLATKISCRSRRVSSSGSYALAGRTKCVFQAHLTYISSSFPAARYPFISQRPKQGVQIFALISGGSSAVYYCGLPLCSRDFDLSWPECIHTYTYTQSSISGDYYDPGREEIGSGEEATNTHKHMQIRRHRPSR